LRVPTEAALLAGIISSPEAYSPRTNPETALERRNLVLQKMLEQGAITQEQYDDPITGTEAPLPDPDDIKPPSEKSEAPFFTSWLRQQVVDFYGAGQAFGGGLHIKSTLDLDLQREAEEAVENNIGGIEPTASVVVMDNATGGVLAMVGGDDYNDSPFNLATNGQRQPGSAMKPFTLVTALGQGVSMSNVYSSQPKEFPFKVRLAKNGKTLPDVFSVSNYGDGYYGSSSLYDATLHSDNSVYAELGLQVGLPEIAETAKAMGISTDLRTANEYSVDGGPFEPYPPAMTLGGLEVGVTPLEMSYAYTTLANDGERVTGSLASSRGGPVGILSVKDGPGEEADFVETNEGVSGENEVVDQRAIDPAVAQEVKSTLEANVEGGTGERAAYGGYAWGKTGTTENNGDAWFCGGAEKVTACVWVGHAETNTPMETEYAGAPVDGGTYPALIWADVMSAYEALADSRKESDDEDAETDTEATVPVAPVAPTETAPVAPTAPAPAPVPEAPVPEEAAPAPAAPAPAEPAAPAPTGGGIEG
jgi:penicillin-binding protein 1A